MKKQAFLTATLFGLSMFFTSCPEDGAGSIGPVDLSGSWFGIVLDKGSPHTNSMTLTQIWDSSASTPDSIYGTIYDENTLTFSGVVREDEATGVAGTDCIADVELTIKRDGFRLEGTAADRPGFECSTEPVTLKFVKERSPDFDMTGNWTGTFSGDEDDGTILFSLNQYGDYVYGNVYPHNTDEADNDTIPVTGYLYGDDLILNGTQSDPDEGCNNTLVFTMIVEEGSMKGKVYGGGGDGGEGGGDCDPFTVSITVSRPAVTKVSKK